MKTASESLRDALLAALAAAPNPAAAQAAALRSIAEDIGAERAALCELDEVGGGANLVLGFGLGEARETELKRGPLPLGVAERELIQSGEARRLFDEKGDCSLPRALGFERAIVAAIPGPGRATGLAAVELPDRIDAYGAYATEFAEACARALGLALDQMSARPPADETARDGNAAAGAPFDPARAGGLFAAMGALATGIGHAFNNRLVPILGYGQLLMQFFQNDEKMLRRMTMIASAAQDLKDMMEFLMRITRGQPPRFELADINRTVREAQALAEGFLGEARIEMQPRLAPGPIQAEFCRDLLLQALLAICYRAFLTLRDAPEPRRIGIETRAEEQHALIRIEDTSRRGLEADWDKATDSLNPIGELDGVKTLNLSIPSSAARKHGGTLDAQALPGGGLAIEIRLPYINASA